MLTAVAGMVAISVAGCKRWKPLPEEVVRNGGYYFDCLNKVVDLKDGEYAEVIEVDGLDGKRPVNLILSLEGYVTGDINGDGLEDVVAILISKCGGTAALVNLEVLINDGERPMYRAMTFLGDRVDVRSIALKGETISVKMITHDEDDPMCCPTKGVEKRFVYREGEMKEM